MFNNQHFKTDVSKEEKDRYYVHFDNAQNKIKMEKS